MDAADPLLWSAQMIGPATPIAAAPRFRRTFALDGARAHSTIRAAHLHVSALGVVEGRLNGEPVGGDVLTPGWSSYEWRIRYASYDVRPLLRDENHLDLLVGAGWWSARLGWERLGPYGQQRAVIAQLEIEFDDGHRQHVVTDDLWTVTASEVTRDHLYDGQTIDARLRAEAPAALPVRRIGFDTSLLTPMDTPPITRHERLAPVGITQDSAGASLVDFGQNLVGWVRMTVDAPRATTITVRHAEVLEDGCLATRPLRTAQATDEFIASGTGRDLFEPTLTFHGFRYAEVSGLDRPLRHDEIEAVVVHSAMDRTGWFECSDESFNQLHRNVVWSFRGNAVGLPTDCPQRDERLGWTGDIAVFAPTAAFLFDADAFLRDWLVDLRLEQADHDGRVPFVVPDLLKRQPDSPFSLFGATAVWGDAAVWVPWALWQAYGDKQVLADQFESMSTHVRLAAEQTDEHGLWSRSLQLGDWLDPDAPPDQPWAAKAEPAVVATACLFRSATIAADAARLLGRTDAAAEFEALAERTRRAFRDHCLTTDGRLRDDASTSYALAIVFDLVDGGARQAAGDRLAELVASSEHRISTGFAGTPFICEALTTTGHTETAYRLLSNRACPSWMYAIDMGATTIWERWDSMLPDGTVNPGEMTSFNHYALGAVADWMHRRIGGVAPLEPGYAKVLVAPRPGGGITWARTRLETARGEIRVEWRTDGTGPGISVQLPDGVSGVLDLDGTTPVDLPPGTTTHPLSAS